MASEEVASSTADKVALDSTKWDSLLEDEVNDELEWKQSQKRTFTRWINQQLKNGGYEEGIEDLKTDFSDGNKLIQLVEVLSGQKLPKHNLHPSFKIQKVENVNLALDFLKNKEGLTVINIGSEDVVNGALKLILGLVWKLILHYSISSVNWDQEEESGQEITTQTMTPKAQLLGWLNSKLPEDVQVGNFTNQWKDGVALGALVDSVAPGLNPMWEEYDPENCLENTTDAMDLAENYLAVAKLIEPHEFISNEIDEQSVMTYLAQYPTAKLIKPMPQSPEFKLVGLDEDLETEVGTENEILIEAIDKQNTQLDVISVELVNLDTDEKVKLVKAANNEDKSLSIKYTLENEGDYSFKFNYNKRPVDDSPYLLRARKKKDSKSEDKYYWVYAVVLALLVILLRYFFGNEEAKY